MARASWPWLSAGSWIRDRRSRSGALAGPISWRRSRTRLAGASIVKRIASLTASWRRPSATRWGRNSWRHRPARSAHLVGDAAGRHPPWPAARRAQDDGRDDDEEGPAAARGRNGAHRGPPPPLWFVSRGRGGGGGSGGAPRGGPPGFGAPLRGGRGAPPVCPVPPPPLRADC